MEKTEDDQCCPMGLKTGLNQISLQNNLIFSTSGVQILGGILAIISGVMLVMFFAKLDDIIGRQYYKIFEVRIICCH